MHDKDTTPIMAARWWRDRMQGTDLSWLQDTSYSMIDYGLICAFVERWHISETMCTLLCRVVRLSKGRRHGEGWWG